MAMIEEIKAALVTQRVSTALIIDDLYDTKPTLGHIEPDAWTNLLADLKTADRALIEGAFPGRDIDETWEAFTTDPRFLDFLWNGRAVSSAFASLFKEYESKSEKGLADLKILQDLLGTTLGFAVATAGSQAAGEAVADLVFMDLFLGPAQDAPSMRSATARVRSLLARRTQRPPMVVLMSSSTRLEEERSNFRNEADILGCQFRVLHKTDIKTEDPVLDVVHRLVTRYADTLRFAAFVDGWQTALSNAAGVLVKRMRRLDLRDYADLQTLILDAEDEGMGGYLLDLYNRVFQYELEGDRPLAALATEIDRIDWADYPPPHFLPAADGMNILDNVMFHHAAAITDADPISLGDVLFRVEQEPSKKAPEEKSAVTDEALVADATLADDDPQEAQGQEEERKEVPEIRSELGECLALMVMTQACDIQRGSVGRYLLLPGIARPMDLQHHKRPHKLTTAVLRDGEERSYVVEWLPETGAFALAEREMRQQLKARTLRRVRRFRTIYALQLQQEFASALTRVGTISVPPARHAVGVTAYFRANDNSLRVIFEMQRRPERAVVLVGRDGTKEKHQFAMAPGAVSELRIAMMSVEASLIAAFHPTVKSKWEKLLVEREVFRALEHGVAYATGGGVRPFKGSDHDVIEIVGPFAKLAPKPGAQWSTKVQLVLHLASTASSDGGEGDDDDGPTETPGEPRADHSSVTAGAKTVEQLLPDTLERIRAAQTGAEQVETKPRHEASAEDP